MKDIKLSDMKLSSVSIVLISLALVLIIYITAVFSPLVKKVSAGTSELKEVQDRIVAAQMVIDDKEFAVKTSKLIGNYALLRSTGFVNTNTVYDDIGVAAKKYGITIDAVEPGVTSKSGNFEVCPIKLEASGKNENILSFIDYFEKSTKGSYVVTALNLAYRGDECTCEMSANLLEPAN